jgi:F-type H+-transporting ATPase subunit b
MSELLKDPMFFYGIAFVIFLGLAYRYGRVPFLNWIDGEILKVRRQLDEAQKLRAEAEATLAEYKARQAAALAEAEALVRHARDEAARLKVQAEADLKSSLARHEQQAIERIRLAEAAAIAEVRQRAIDLAMNAARHTLAKELQGEAAARLVDQAIADLPKSAGAKAKAA